MITNCSGTHCVGAMSDGTKSVAQPFRVFGNKHLKADLYGKEFKSSEEAFSAMHERGYGELFYPRSSVVIPCFAGLDSQVQQARFDALYRYWKHLIRTAKKSPWGRALQPQIIHLQKELTKLAKKVGIFHPCTKQFNQP